MNPSDIWSGKLALVSRGEAEEWERDLFEPQIRTAIRYADPAAWITATAVALALAPIKDAVAVMRDRVGVVVISEQGPTETMTAVAEAARTHLSSPLRYPASNPGSLVGVTCIAFGLRGPTLNLTMPLAPGIPIALIAATGWVRRQGAPLILLAACSQDTSQRPRARCLALSGPDSSLPSVVPLQENDVAWLCFQTGVNVLHP